VNDGSGASAILTRGLEPAVAHDREEHAMVQRQLCTKSQIEELCLMALQGQLGLNHLDFVKIGPYSGPESWTWKILEAGPDIDEPGLKKTVVAARAFQEHFDLKKPNNR
jgi:hypothetical protein